MIGKNTLVTLQDLKGGMLTIKMPNGQNYDFGEPQSDLQAELHIHSWAALKTMLEKGDIGFAQAYMQGNISTPNMLHLLKILAKNATLLDSALYGNFWHNLVHRMKNLFRKNTHTGSKKNIQFHYDLGNDFYKLWLDESMTYSSGFFETPEQSLHQAQKNKYRLILDKLWQEGKDILEIGSGWGGFIQEAEKRGFRVKGLTLSNEQKNYVDNLIDKQELQSQVHIEDYREQQQKFGNIVSIEMFEAVGKDYWEEYFRVIKKCLADKGKAIIQTITIQEEVYKKYSNTSDFIREYIFPGGYLPTDGILQSLFSKHKLKLVDQKSFGHSYKKTLQIWLENFFASQAQVRALGYDEKFLKMWELYLSYCAAGFAASRTDVVQYTLEHA